jgi:glyoxylase-like metal-dependent hydrolase (beta-lactamase superfamily II)
MSTSSLPSESPAEAGPEVRPCPPPLLGRPVRLSASLWQVAGEGITHPWDANAYLLHADEPTLIDCGSTAGYPALRRALDAAGTGPGKIRRVLGTHGHWDHVSGVAGLRQDSDVELCLHAGERAAVESGDPVRTTASLLYGQPAPRLRVDSELYDGQRLLLGAAAIDVVHTPGHTPGSVCFVVSVDSYRLLVAGDTLWGGFHPDIGSDVSAWHRSLDRLLEMELDYLTFGHGTHRLLPDAHERLREARVRLGTFYDPWGRPPYLSFSY